MANILVDIWDFWIIASADMFFYQASVLEAGHLLGQFWEHQHLSASNLCIHLLFLFNSYDNEL